MNEALLSTDPVIPAAAALAAVRHLRRLCISGHFRHALVVHCPGVLSRAHRVLDKAGEGELSAMLPSTISTIAFRASKASSRVGRRSDTRPMMPGTIAARPPSSIALKS